MSVSGCVGIVSIVVVEAKKREEESSKRRNSHIVETQSTVANIADGKEWMLCHFR